MSKYLDEFKSEFDFLTPTPCSYAEILASSLKADVILISDYRSLLSSQKFITKFISDIGKKSSQLALAVDLFFSKDQQILDEYLSDKLPENKFRKLIDYNKNWGYPWKNYKQILVQAKKLDAKIFAMDVQPRNKISLIHKRDFNFAWKIFETVYLYPDHKLIAFTGEARLSKNHIPYLIKQFKLRDEKIKIVRIFQNPDIIYKLYGKSYEDCYRLNDETYCVMNTTKAQKERSFKSLKEKWKAKCFDDEKTDLELSIYNMIDNLLDYFKIDKFEYSFLPYKGIAPALVDHYPLILSSKDFESIFPNKISNIEIGKSLYLPSINTICINDFDLVDGSEEAAHFVNSAMKCELYQKITIYNTSDLFYIKTIEEALGYLGSKILNPEREYFPLENLMKHKIKLKSIIKQNNLSEQQIKLALDFIKEHDKFIESYDSYNEIPKIIKKVFSEENRLYQLLFHDLGYRLGEKLYSAIKKRKISKDRIKNIFTYRLNNRGDGLKLYMELSNI
jgi:uncharacterized iron-regulated protein